MLVRMAVLPAVSVIVRLPVPVVVRVGVKSGRIVLGSRRRQAVLELSYGLGHPLYLKGMQGRI